MKHFHLFLAAILIFSAVRSQNTYTWRGANNGSWTTSTNWTPTRSSTANTDILRFNDGSSKTITGVPSETIGKLLITNNTSVTLNAASNNRTLTIRNSPAAGDDMVVAAGSELTIGTGNNFSVTLNNNTTADISGTLVINSGRTFATNTSGTRTTVSATGFIDNMGTLNSSNSDRLSFDAGSTYNHAQNGGTIPQSEWDDASTIIISGVTGSVPGRLNQDFGNFTWDCPAQSGGCNFSGNLTTVNGNFTIANTSTRRVLLGSNDNVELDIAGDLIVGSAGNTAILDMDVSIGLVTINLSGNLITLGNGQIDNSGNNNATFNFIKPSGIQNINLGNANSFVAAWGGNMNIGSAGTSNKVVLQSNMALAPTYLTNINVTNGSTLDMGGFVISNAGTFTASSGSTLAIGHASGITPTSGAVGNIQLTGTRTFSTGANYAYTGSISQVTGTGLPATVARLTIDNSAGVGAGAGVSLSQPTAISTELELTNGFLQTTATNIITVNNGATATAINNAFVAGPMRKTGNSSFTFPTGWAGLNGGRIPIRVSSLSSSVTLRAEYKRMPSTTVGTNKTAPLHHVSGCEYWDLYPTTGSVNATVTMYWNSYSNCSPVSYVNDFASLVVSRSNGSTWASVGNTGGSMGSATIISSANTTMNSTTLRYFSLGSTSAVSNPLPVLFTEIKAFSKNNGIQVEWTNLSEKDIDHYTIQRSANARDFTELGSYLPQRNLGDRTDYSGFDAHPLPGAGYYRIQAIETSGKLIYSKTVKVETGNTVKNITVYPNPAVAGRELTVSMTGLQAGNYSLQVFSSAGQQVYQSAIRSSGNSLAQNLPLPATIAPGLYTLSISGSGYRESKLVLIQ